MIIQKLKFLLFPILLILLLSACSKDKNNENTVNQSQSGTVSTSIKSNSEIEKLKKEGKYQDLISYYEERIKSDSNDINKIELANTYLKYGNSYYKENEYSNKALEILEGLTDSTQKFYYIGYANEISKNYNRAILSYEKSLKLTKDNEEIANIKNQLGHVYDLKGDFKKAGEYYLEAEKAGLDLPANLINRGRVEYRNKNYEEAKRYFTKVLGMDVDSFTKAEMYFNLATVELNSSGKIDEVIALSNSGITENANYPNNYLNLALSYIQKGGDNLEKAPSELEKAIKIYPDSTLAYKYKGVYYYIKDDFQSAIENFNKQFEVADKDIILMETDRVNFKNEATYDIAKSYALMGDAKNTIINLEKVMPGENKLYYYGFLKDLTIKDGPFSKIQTNKEFGEYTLNVLKLYNK